MNDFTEFSSFRLAEGIQVRREKFGLLFYNYRGPRIYFVPSKKLIDDDFFDGKQTIGQLIDSIQSEHALPRKKIEHSLKTIFQTLEDKGLING
ncbi:hypothetical protein SBDP1_870030 [Syntrophobacter sp. SbD1]|nr:hypothetical protein SBDP1_870030 [Syntrophobacter sp. SbD1]